MSLKNKNFTSFERKFLLECMVEYKNIIENKKTDGTSIKAKQEVWVKIAAAFNASTLINEKVTDKQLQKLWANLKQRQRGELVKERQHRIATGGGEAISDVTIDPIIEIINPHLLMEIPTAHSDNPQIDESVKKIVSTDAVKENLPISIEDLEYADNTEPETKKSKIDTLKETNRRRLSPLQKYEDVKIKFMQTEAELRCKREKQLIELEKILYKEKINIEREKFREAKARAELAELELNNVKSSKI